jgi:hypothetical protein
MSVFVPQLKIPFQAVIRWLRYLEPSNDMPADAWAKAHAEDIAPGDILFVWEIMYSPWGDASSGIGVADGDSFRVSQLFFVTKWDGQEAVGYSVVGDTYERHSIQNYFEDCAISAKENGTGYYYSIVRSNPPLTADRLTMLEAIDSYGPNGWRAEDAPQPDLPFAFFQAAGYGVEARTGVLLPIDQLGFALFCDKEPPAGNPVPDIRKYTAPVYKDAHRNDASGTAEAAPPPEVQSSLPKMPSFFNQGPKRVNNPLSGAAFATMGSAVPPAPNWDDSSAVGGDEAPSAVPNVSDAAEPESAEAAPSAPLWGSDDDVPLEEPPVVEEEVLSEDSGNGHEPSPVDLEPTTNGPASPAASGDAIPAFTAPPAAVPVLKAPRIVPPRPSGGLPPVPSRDVPPIPAGMTFDLPTAEEIASSVSAEIVEPEPVQQPAKIDMKITTELDPSMLPAYLQEPPKTPGVEDIMAAIDTTIKETSEQKKLELKSDSPRNRPGRGNKAEQQQQQQVQQQQVPAEKLDEALVEAAKVETKVDDVDLPPGPPKKKKPDPVEVARAQEMQKLAQLKEPVAVKSGVAGLVSKLEQQASKASARLETQVDEIQNNLGDELNRLLGKVSTSEKRNAKSAEGLRINLTGQMDSVANSVKSKVADATHEGIENIKSFEGTGASQLSEKHEYLRTSLTGSFDEVKARAETVAKSFEESLNVEAKQVVSALEELRDQWRGQFAELEESYIEVLQAACDGFKDRLNGVSASATTVVSDRHNVFESQLGDLQARHLKGLEHTRTMLLSKLSRHFVVSETEMLKLQTTALEETLMPKLKQHREELRVVTTEFQHKLSQDLHEKGELKIAEFSPILEEKKEKLMELLKETTTVKDSIQEQLKTKLEAIFADLKTFVDQSIHQAQSSFSATEEQLADIDREVRALADPSTIEGDVELLNERNSVLGRLDEITETNKEHVLNTLRSNLAALEERGKSLQEELISSMEEDAYVVRRASEQALVSIREAVRDSFVAIQTAQDERMPM